MKAIQVAGAPMAVQEHTGFGKLFTSVYNKKLRYRKETVRLHDITCSSAVAEKKHCRVDQFWVGGG